MTIGGDAIEFECADTTMSVWVCRAILEGSTYPHFSFLDDVQVIFDVGANCGATSVFFAHLYPHAQVHAFEPAGAPRAILERNAASRSNIAVHPIGLGASDRDTRLYYGTKDSILASVLRRPVNDSASEQVQLRDGGAWTAEHGIDRIDILKVDVEGCELEVVSSLARLLPSVQVLYVEYDSRANRRGLDHVLEGTHELLLGALALDQGECVYLRKDLADLDAATERLRELYFPRMGARFHGQEAPTP